ncbi:NAD(P)/FAD-dependent oxidoreductase [Bartonella tamiae]|uniref:FAD dependent oxidoreductase domain-containing protein n=1 Tax=Bartonella tamiae Th239 TaxID=1094558 RepID=J0ZLV8_9HYPH|nr:FAD-binding oxidoreductase [Bartonella tamiae]EJF89393.1 hypothetical protein ME5_01944 [Bartonella tamiae Th239]EJF92742.1 hypothetical protein MEG_01912 [Bartonella tamiae Th307]
MEPQNVISPGRSFYEDTISKQPAYASLVDNKSCDIAIIGAGFTGLSAAYHLAKTGLDVVLIDAAKIGDGASGRNGGQLGTGLRQWVDTLEKHYGYTRTKALFDLSQEAKHDVISFQNDVENDVDFVKGQLSLIHKKRELRSHQTHVETMARYGYHSLRFMDQNETSERLGSSFYQGGIRDLETGHLNPLKFVIHLAKKAYKVGAHIFENTCAVSLSHQSGKCIVSTKKATIKADRVLLASNAYNLGLNHFIDAQIVAIRSYIGATSPLPENSTILKGNEAVDDSRFVVRYFRKSKDNRLLFGGAESYDDRIPHDLRQRIQKQIIEIYPQLQQLPLTHAWGGTVAITVERMPYICELMPKVTYCGGYSGHGVMLAPFLGKLYAEAVLGKRDRFDQFKELKISKFPGGKSLRRPLLFLAMNWFAMMDRF